MDRATVYTQEQGRSVDFLFAQRATMIGLAKLSQAAFGSGTVVRGLAVTPNSPAALNVLVGIGEIYAMTQVDATTWGALPADTTDVILKQGLNMAAQTVSTPAPTTSGYSINYLIEAQYQDQDNVPVVLPFYNSNNPQIPLNGQGGGGASLPTERQGVCVIQAKAGIAATTGTQTTPAVDAGWTALAVVTVANGQSTVTSGNISVPAGVPQFTSLLQMMQTGSAGYAVDTSTTANVISIALTPAVTAYTDGQEITFKAANSNTGPCTINFGGGTVNLVGAAGAFQGGEIVAGNQYTGIYSASLNEVVLNSQTAGALQVNPATKSQHAVQLGQVQSGAARVAGTVVSKSANYTGATTDYDNVITFTNTGDYTLPTAAAAGIGWKTTIVNASTIAAPKQVRILRASTDTIDADATTTVYVLPGESVEIRADGTSKWWTRGRTPKGRIINVASFSDVGSTTSSTTDVNTQAANFSYQPISPNSLLEIQWSFEGEIANLASTNTIGAFTGYEVTSGNAALGAIYNVSAPSAAGGVGVQTPSIVLVNALSNTALTARLFALFARTSNASASVSVLVPRCEIREIQNA